MKRPNFPLGRNPRRGPKPHHLTPEQEELLGRVERLQARARVWEIGVCRFLDNEYNSDIQRDEAARVLNDASGMRREATRIQEQIHQQQHSQKPQRQPKREAKKK